MPLQYSSLLSRNLLCLGRLAAFPARALRRPVQEWFAAGAGRSGGAPPPFAGRPPRRRHSTPGIDSPNNATGPSSAPAHGRRRRAGDAAVAFPAAAHTPTATSRSVSSPPNAPPPQTSALPNNQIAFGSSTLENRFLFASGPHTTPPLAAHSPPHPCRLTPCRANAVVSSAVACVRAVAPDGTHTSPRTDQPTVARPGSLCRTPQPNTSPSRKRSPVVMPRHNALLFCAASGCRDGDAA